LVVAFAWWWRGEIEKRDRELCGPVFSGVGAYERVFSGVSPTGSLSFIEIIRGERSGGREERRRRRRRGRRQKGETEEEEKVTAKREVERRRQGSFCLLGFDPGNKWKGWCPNKQKINICGFSLVWFN
jgi:hypothetical protein